MDSFWEGFEKRAIHTVDGVRIGAVAGALLGGGYSYYVAHKAMGEFKNHKGAVDAHEAFNKIKHLSPGTKLVTESELRKHVDGMEGFYHKHMLKNYAELLGKGNAFAYHPEMGGLDFAIPDIIKGQKVIMSADKVHPSILAHEMGHIIDFEEISKRPKLKRLVEKHLRGTVKREEEAWNKAPGKGHDHLRDVALNTYKTGVYGVPLAVGAGGFLGGLIGHLSKRASDPISEWQDESSEVDKKAKKVGEKEQPPDPLTILQGSIPDTSWRGCP